MHRQGGGKSIPHMGWDTWEGTLGTGLVLRAHKYSYRDCAVRRSGACFSFKFFAVRSRREVRGEGRWCTLLEHGLALSRLRG